MGSILLAGGLTAADEDWARERAEILQRESSRNANRHGAARLNRSYEDELAMHLQGQRGEIFAARIYQVSAEPHVNVYHSHVPDIGDSGQVRTRSKAWHDLIVRDDDWDDFYYILVIGDSVRGTPLWAVGGIWGACAKRDEWRKDPSGDGAAWFVPQSALEPPENVPPGWV